MNLYLLFFNLTYLLIHVLDHSSKISIIEPLQIPIFSVAINELLYARGSNRLSCLFFRGLMQFILHFFQGQSLDLSVLQRKIGICFRCLF